MTKMKTGFYLVQEGILPEAIKKTIRVKAILKRGEVRTINEAVAKMNLSRSAYYKYKDSVFSYDELFSRRIVNLYLLLNDSPGVLSSVLAFLGDAGANILTVNQSIPVDGAASVNISLRLTDELEGGTESLSSVADIAGVLEVKILSAE